MRQEPYKPLPEVARRRGPRQGFWGLLFVLPILVLFAAFKFQPIVRTLILSFTDASPLSSDIRFIGFENFARLAQDKLFINSLGVTAYYVLGSVLPVVVLSLALALLLNVGLRGIRVFRVLLFLPVVIAFVVVPILWQFLYHPYGLVNTGLEAIGLTGPDWLRDKSAVIPAFIIATDWRLIPLFSIIYLAGLQSIPAQLYDAAEVDGATTIQRFRWITLPMLRPTMLVVIVLATIFTAKSFTLAFILTGGGPDNASLTLPLFIYRTAFGFFRVGYASAAAVVLLAVMTIVTLINLKVFKSDD